jgi:hypothetical protein
MKNPRDFTRLTQEDKVRIPDAGYLFGLQSNIILISRENLCNLVVCK